MISLFVPLPKKKKMRGQPYGNHVLDIVITQKWCKLLISEKLIRIGRCQNSSGT